MELNIIVTSYARAEERFDIMKNQLDKLNSKNIYFYPCFDGVDLTNDSYSLKINVKKGYVYRNGDNLTPGDIGCSLSHIGAISMAKALNMEYVIILEDDVLLAEDFQERMEYLFKVLPKNWDHVYLSGVPHIEKLPPSEKLLITSMMNVRPSVWTDCTYAYIVRNTAYDKIVKGITSLETTTDDMINKLIFETDTIKSYTLFPFAICANTSLGSANRGGEKMASNHPSVKYFKNKMT